jgi:hypothetical protein
MDDDYDGGLEVTSPGMMLEMARLAMLRALLRDPNDSLELLLQKAAEANRREAAARAAEEQARKEREAADRRIEAANKASNDLDDFRTRTERELKQRRSDIDQNEAIIAERERVVAETEADLVRRVLAHEHAVNALKGHLAA